MFKYEYNPTAGACKVQAVHLTSSKTSPCLYEPIIFNAFWMIMPMCECAYSDKVEGWL